jgi:uncharacterized protein
MELREEYPLLASVDSVWSELRNPQTIADCWPGAELIQDLGQNKYEGRISFKLGPKSVAFSGTAEFENNDASHTGRLTAAGSDMGGRSRAHASVTFAAQSAAADSEFQSVVKVAADIKMLGPLASFAESGGVFVGRQLLSDFAVTFESRLESSSGASAGSAVLTTTPHRIQVLKVLMVTLRERLGRLMKRLQKSHATSAGSINRPTSGEIR